MFFFSTLHPINANDPKKRSISGLSVASRPLPPRLFALDTSHAMIRLPPLQRLLVPARRWRSCHLEGASRLVFSFSTGFAVLRPLCHLPEQSSATQQHEDEHEARPGVENAVVLRFPLQTVSKPCERETRVHQAVSQPANGPDEVSYEVMRERVFLIPVRLRVSHEARSGSEDCTRG